MSKMSLKSIVLHIISSVLLLMACGLTGCDKKPINGDLDGQWQVMDVEPEPTTIIDQRIYYCFSLHTCTLTHYGQDRSDCMAGNMTYKGSSLFLDFPNYTTPEGMLKLQQYGIRSNPVTFTIETLNNKSLVMTDGFTTVTLRKF